MGAAIEPFSLDPSEGKLGLEIREKLDYPRNGKPTGHFMLTMYASPYPMEASKELDVADLTALREWIDAALRTRTGDNGHG